MTLFSCHYTLVNLHENKALTNKKCFTVLYPLCNVLPSSLIQLQICLARHVNSPICQPQSMARVPHSNKVKPSSIDYI